MFDSFRHRRAFTRGTAHLVAARWPDAITAFRAAAELDPGDCWSHNNLAIALLHAGETEEAAAVFQRAITMNPGFGEAYENRAAALARLERWDEAAAVYRRAAELHPANVETRKNLALVAFHAERWEESANAFQAAIALGGADADIHQIRARALAHLDRWDQAIEAFRCSLALKPGQAEAQSGLVDALMRQERFEEAVDALRDAIELDASSFHRHAQLANVLARLGRTEEAVVAIEQALSVGDGSPEHLMNLVNALSTLERFDTAVQVVARAIAQAPGDATLHAAQGTLQVRLEDWGGAAQSFQHAIECDPTNPVYFKQLGATLFQAGSFEGAASSYRHALSLEPSDLETRTNLAVCLGRLGSTPESLELHRQLAELAPDDVSAQLALGGELLRAGAFEESVPILQRAAALSPEDPQAYFLLVDPLLRLGRNEEARAAHRAAVALGGELPPLPRQTAAAAFEAKQASFWTDANLPPSVFRVERWLEGLADAEPAPEHRGRLLFVLDNDYGELTTLMYLVLGRVLAAESRLLLPERLMANNADALPGRTRGYTSVADILEAVDAERPEAVFLCSGYLYAIHDLMTLDEVAELTAAIEQRGCRVVTTDPFLGMFSIAPPAELVSIAIPDHSDELDLDAIREVKAVEDVRLRSDFTRSEEIFRDAGHLYPAFCATPEGRTAPSDRRNLSFFNDRLVCPELDGPDGDARPVWLFVLSRTDFETQRMFVGARFADIVARMMTDALAAGRHPVMIAPDEFVASVTARMPTVEGVDILSFCPFNRMISLLLAAEHAFYWNIVSHSILVRLFNGRPVVLFDHGHLVRNIPAMKERVVDWYYQGREPVFRDHEEPLTVETVAAWTAEERVSGPEVVARFRRAQSPEAMIASIVGRSETATGG